MKRTKKSYRQLRVEITGAVIANGPYSHNIISLCLRMIADKYGKEKANKTIRDFNLNRMGWKEEK